MGKMIRCFQHSPRTVAVLIAILILLLGTIGGTLAVIRAKSPLVLNTFSVRGIDIDLYETDTEDGDEDPYTNTYQMMPGQMITKDPIVAVNSGSMACWLFVQLTESEKFDEFLTYEMQEDWQVLAGEKGVYYRTVDALNSPQYFTVLKDNQVKVLDSVTLDMLRGLTQDTVPRLIISAYAVQREGIVDVENAWQLAKEL